MSLLELRRASASLNSGWSLFEYRESVGCLSKVDNKGGQDKVYDTDKAGTEPGASNQHSVNTV
jgi:hypothetical protein